MRPNTRREWNDEELDTLRESAGTGMTIGQVAVLLGRPQASVRSKARKLGISYMAARSGEHKISARRMRARDWMVGMGGR